MALSAGQISLSVSADTRDFGSKLKRDIDKEVRSSGMDDIGNFIGNTLKAGITAVMAGVGVVVATGIAETLQASEGVAQLTAGIASTGNAANVSVKGMTDLASAIQNMSGQTDDSIVKSEQLLLTFTNIKNVGPDKIFDQATLASADMAAKMGGDASSNAILLGKALNDPVKGITALTRVGVSFTDAQKEQIAAMVEAGDTVGAQKIILGELQTEFGGAAKAAGESLPGQLKIAQRSFEDLSQSVVESVMPAITPAIQSLVPAIQAAEPEIKRIAKVVVDNLQKAWENLQPVIKIVWDILVQFGRFIVDVVIPAIGNFSSFIKDNYKWLGLIASVIVGVIAGLKLYEAVMGVVRIATMLWATAQGILNGTIALNPIAIIIVAIVALVAAIIWVATQTTFFQDVWKAVTDFVIGAVQAMGKWFGDIFQGIGDAIAAVFNWVGENWPLILAILTGPIGLAVLWIVDNWDGIVKFFRDSLDNIGRFFSDTFTNIVNVISDIFGGIGSIISGIFKGAINYVIDSLNGFLGFINVLIDGIDMALDGIKTVSGGSIDMHINHIGKIPHLAEGGVVMPKPGGQVVKVAEAGEAEAVIPLSKLSEMRGGGTVNYYAAPNASIDSQGDLFTAMRRARLLAGWN